MQSRCVHTATEKDILEKENKWLTLTCLSGVPHSRHLGATAAFEGGHFAGASGQIVRQTDESKMKWFLWMARDGSRRRSSG